MGRYTLSYVFPTLASTALDTTLQLCYNSIQYERVQRRIDILFLYTSP